MESNEIKKFIETLTTDESKKFFKDVVDSIAFKGSIVVGLGYVIGKNLNLSNISALLSEVLPTEIFNVSIGGLPVGGIAFKFFTLSVTTVIVGEAIKVGLEINKNKEKATDIITKEIIKVIIFIGGLAILGNLGMDMLKTINTMSIF